MWKIARQENPIWYFDATGSINKDVEGQKKPMFYALVFHDTTHKSIIPFAEFVTTANDQTSISKYLCSIKLKLDENSKENILPKIIVTDMGWALINAAMLTFNCCNVSNYLNWCYDMMFKPYDLVLSNSMKIKSYLCSTHFLKNIIKKAKSVTVFSNHITSTFIFMFTLVQNSISVKQIEIYLKHIHNIFNNPYLDWTVYESLNFMSKEIRHRKLSFLNSEMETSPQQKERDEHFEYFLKQSNMYNNVDHDDNIKINSPFTMHYDLLMTQLNSDLNAKSKNNLLNVVLNEYFCPQLFAILEEKLYMIPLWSGIMIRSEIENFKIKTRLTNNPVENWFGQVKNHILCKIKKRLASVLVTLLYSRLLSKYYEYYSTLEKKVDQNKTEKEKLNKLYEQWSDKNIKRKNKGEFLIFIIIILITNH